MHHHPMWLTEPGVANIMYFRDDQNRANANRDWVCTCGDCDGLVGVWSCPGFYTGTITVSPDYGDDFTPARSNEHVDVCKEPSVAKCTGSARRRPHCHFALAFPVPGANENGARFNGGAPPLV
jgi:hypothetical protein